MEGTRELFFILFDLWYESSSRESSQFERSKCVLYVCNVYNNTNSYTCAVIKYKKKIPNNDLQWVHFTVPYNFENIIILYG